MKVAIMQPYFFPYIGYFQLLTFSDYFVFYDDVQYSKGGWINRNRILINGNITWITLPVIKSSHKLAIKEKYYTDDNKKYEKLLSLIQRGYHDSLYFSDVYPLISHWLLASKKNVATFNKNIITGILNYLGIEKNVELSSEIKKDNDLTGEERVLDICKRLGASHYINPEGGINLYDRSNFSGNGISLHFLRPSLVKYRQSGSDWAPSLSIIDVLMWNDKEKTKDLIYQHDIVE